MEEWSLSDAFLNHISNKYECSNIEIIDETKIRSGKDATKKCFLKSDNDQRFMIVSHIDYGDLVSKSNDNVQYLKSILTEQTADGVLDAEKVSSYRSYTYAIYPLCFSLAEYKFLGKLDRTICFSKLIKWYKELALETMKSASFNDVELILEGLKSLSSIAQEHSPEICREVDELIAQINCGEFTVNLSVSHNDLWRGNVLKIGRFTPQLKIIDWAGMNKFSNPFFDLSKAMCSFNIKGKLANRVYASFAELFSYDPGQIRACLYIALGGLSLDLGNFPRDRFLAMTEECRNHVLLNAV